MIEWIVSSSVLIGAVLLLRLIFRDKISKRFQYALWALVLLRLLIPGSIAESAASIGNLLSSVTEKPVMQAASGALTPEVSYDFAVQEVLDSYDYPAEIFSVLPEARQEALIEEYQPEIQQRLDSYEKAYDTAQILKTLWWIGCALMAAFLLASNLHFCLKLKRTRRKMDIDAFLPVYQSAAVETPCLFGLIRPSVYLPDTVMDENALAYILAHEQTHYRHWDHIWSVIRCICLTMHWYNPLVWIAVKVSRADSELACDEGTLAKLGDDSRESYGRTLIEMSCAKPSMADYLLTATTMTGDKKSLYHRILNIAKKPKFILAAVISLTAISLVIVGCTFTSAKKDPADPTTEATQPTESITHTETTVPATTAPPPTTLPPEAIAPTEPAETQSPTYPMGNMGEKTDGILRSLEVGMSPACNSYPFGENILLCNPQSGVYQIRSLKDGSVLARATDARVANTVTVTEDQIIYFAVIHRKIIFRDINLEVTKVLDFNLNDSVSDMTFSQDGTKAYYSTDAQTLVELDLETFEERVIPIAGPAIWSLTGVYFDDTVLSYWGRTEKGDYTAFIDLKTGAYLGNDDMSINIWGNNYYIIRSRQGTVEHLVVSDGAYRYMTPKDHGMSNCYTTVLPQLNSLFALSYDYENTNQIILDLYDLNTKQRTHSLTVDLDREYGHSAKILSDPSGTYVWMCLKVGNHYDGYRMVLYRWDFKANAIEDTAVYGYGG